MDELKELAKEIDNPVLRKVGEILTEITTLVDVVQASAESETREAVVNILAAVADDDLGPELPLILRGLGAIICSARLEME